MDVEEYKEKLKGKFNRKFKERCKLLEDDLIEEAKESIPKEPQPAPDDGYGDDIIVVSDNCKSCETLVEILSTPILQHQIEVVTALSNRGQRIISQLGDDIALPLYVVHEKRGYIQKPLKELIRKYGRK